MSGVPHLQELRAKIDAVDDQLLRLMNERAKHALAIAAAKTAAGEVDCFHRPEREAEVLRRMAAQNDGPLPADTVNLLFRELMSSCLSLEKPLTVAFLGPAGTFTQQAAYKHFGHAIEASPLPAIDEIFRAVESGTCQYGVVPVENSTEGVVTHTLDSFLKSSLVITGEVSLRIHHNLLTKVSELAAIDEIFSHQQSLAQCREWLDRFLPGVCRTAVSSNAEAARLAAVNERSGAIAGEVASELYGLRILEKNIEDEPDNTTRFLVIGRIAVGRTGDDKTSLLLSTRNHPGALYSVLEPLARYGISMSKIESRPSRRGLWDYVFFIDVDGHRHDAELSQALAELETSVTLMKVLGSYPKAAC